MVAREKRDSERRKASRTSAISILFDAWRELLAHPMAPLSRALTSAAKSPRTVASDLRHASTSGVANTPMARRLVWTGLLAFGFGVLLSTILAGRAEREWVPLAESAVWLTWLVVRLVVIRIVVRPRTTSETSSVTGAWAVGMMPFIFALEYYTSILAGWLGSAVATWWVLKKGPTGPADARRATLAFIALEVAALIGLAVLRNLSVVGLLMSG